MRYFCFLSDGVVFGEFDPLVGLHTGGTEVFNAVRTKPSHLSVVITCHTELQEDEVNIRG